MTRGLTFVLLLVAVATATASANPESRAPIGTKLEHPAQPELVEALVASSIHHGTPVAAKLAGDLGAAGGHAAAVGIADLLERGDRSARLPALEAVSRIGLRTARLAAILRRTAREREGVELVTAIEALGAAGDGRDVPLLLELAARKDPHVRAASFRALRTLTGTPVPPVLARWRWHWKTIQRRVETTVGPSLEAVEAAPDGEDVPFRLQNLRDYGWADPELVSETVHAWLVSPDSRLRCAACWLVAELRLADYAPLVLRTSRHAVQRDLQDECARTLVALGVSAAE